MPVDPTTLDPSVAKRLESEHVIWLTTVGKAGTPIPSVVWFLWSEGEFVVMSQSHTTKVGNIARHPRVALSFNSNLTGEEAVVFPGSARIDPEGLRPEERTAIDTKYGVGIQRLGMTPESFHAEYSEVIRIQPDKVRVIA